jgi:hypothetical protein
VPFFVADGHLTVLPAQVIIAFVLITLLITSLITLCFMIRNTAFVLLVITLMPGSPWILKPRHVPDVLCLESEAEELQ